MRTRGGAATLCWGDGAALRHLLLGKASYLARGSASGTVPRCGTAGLEGVARQKTSVVATVRRLALPCAVTVVAADVVYLEPTVTSLLLDTIGAPGAQFV